VAGRATTTRSVRAALRALVAAVVAASVAGLAPGRSPLGGAAPAGAELRGGDAMVLAFGTATFRGSTEGMALAAPVVGMAPTRTGAGYWLVAADGGVFGFGAPFHGALSGFPLRLPVAAMAATPDGGGYWLVTEDGGVFPFGSARWFGGLVGVPLNAPVTDIVAAPDGDGYWLLGEDGGVFSFGSAAFFGSTGGMRLNAPVVAMAAARDGRGYWLVAKDGGVFTFGSAAFYGSTGGMRLNAPVVGAAVTGAGRGYWLVAEDGGVFSFGDAPFHGSGAGVVAPGRRVVQMAAMPGGGGYRLLALAEPPDVPLARLGDRGPAVVGVQLRLESMGYWTGGVNGVYGPLTQQAVYAFQKVNGLPRTGDVDPTTRVAFRTARRPLPRSTAGYVAEVDKARQVVLIARDGRAEWVFNTSTGTERPYWYGGVQYLADTPVGRFRVTHQVNGVRTGALGTLYRPKYFHPDGIAFHGHSSVPPYPASHGCVRVSNAAIDFIWSASVIPLGTDVWVY
jgi:hypothetical protein